MPESVFPYPGGKTYLANWIIEQFPEHECFVEVFGGSASILVNKPRSHIEVFNDLDSDIVQFFEVLRNRSDALQEWLEAVPYSRELHTRWVTEFYDGERPDDPVERAGRFFFLRFAQFGGNYDSPSGFSAGKHDEAGRFVRAGAALSDFADRLRHVTIEQRDYADIIELYDSSETLFYFDPPYVEVGSEYYSQDEPFAQCRFVNELHDVTGNWIVSYEELPPGLSDYHVIDRTEAQRMSAKKHRTRTHRTERLVMNFAPDGEPIMTEYGQCGLNQFV